MVVEQQIVIFIKIMAIGFGLAFLADCYHVLRRMFKPAKLSLNIGDLIFWLLAAASAFLFLLHINLAEMRLYIFLALAGGWFVYAYFLSRRMQAILWRMLKLVARLFRGVAAVIIMPFAIVWKITTLPLRILKLVLIKPNAILKKRVRPLWLRIAAKLTFRRPLKK